MLDPIKNAFTVTGLRALIAKIKGSLAAKVDTTDVVTSWQDTPDDSHVPSEKLVKDTLDNLPPGTAVKGDAESEYRTGNVNLTPANIGAATSAQGAKADSAIQGVSVNSSPLTPDANKSVNVVVPTASTTTPAMDGSASAGTENHWAKGDHVHPTDTSREAVSNKKQTVDPTSTTDFASSKAVADFVNSSVATNTANFLDNFSLTDLGLTYPATNVQIAAALNSYTWPAGVTVTNNDYVYVEIENPQTTGVDDRVERYKYSDALASWGYEYTLNNSSFTAAEIAAIDSGITATDKSAYDAHLVNTSNPHSVTKAQVDLGNVVNTGDSDTPVSGGTTKFTTGGAYTELAKKADKSSTVTNVAYDTTNKKITKTINGTTTDVVSASTLKTDMSLDNVGNFKAVSTVANQGLTSTEQSNARTNIGAGTYSKPIGGIPSTDLASGVQTSLGKADSAVQDSSYVHTDNNFTSTYKSNVDSNTSARHTHSNKSVLDGISSSDVSNWDGKANDSAVVHLAGTEDVTGVKRFCNSVYPSQISGKNNENLKMLNEQSAVFTRGVGTNYTYWTSAQKDGNHFRQWTIDVTDAVDRTKGCHSIITVELNGYYNLGNSNGYLVLVSSSQSSSSMINEYHDYIVAEGYARSDYAISGLLFENNRFLIKVISKKPNFDCILNGLKLTYKCTLPVDLTAVSGPVVEIVEGLPDWAGGKTTPVKVTASGSPVITESSASNYKTKQTAVSITGGTLKGVSSMSQNENGEVTLTLNDIQDGTTSKKGVVQLEDSYSSTSTTKAATPNSVKAAYDLANGKADKVSGATSGNFASFDSNGNLTDSGNDASDFAVSSVYNETDSKCMRSFIKCDSTGTQFYRKMATAATTGNQISGSVIRLDGCIGAWASSDTTDFRIVIRTRIAVKFEACVFKRVGSGNAFNMVDFELYKESDNTYSLWLKSSANYTVCTISAFAYKGANIVYDGADGTPTGTLVASASQNYTTIPDAATATPQDVASSAEAGSSAKYAREDHTHGISVATGDNAGQIKVAGQNVSVNGWKNIYVLDGPVVSYDSDAIYLI